MSEPTLEISEILDAIHQGVIFSSIRHVISFPPALIIQYLTTYPYFQNADVLYYFLLKQVGSNAHYTTEGIHVIHLQPELTYVYVLAEQPMKIPSHLDRPTSSIYSQITSMIDRTIICEAIRHRHEIITGTAPIENAMLYPSIALIHLKYIDRIGLDCLIEILEVDHLDKFDQLSRDLLELIIVRMSCVVACAPDLWKHKLRSYYTEHLIRLDIANFFPELSAVSIHSLYRLLPELTGILPNWSELGIRIWRSRRIRRTYMLGFDLKEGVPSDEIIQEAVTQLSEDGIEQYTRDITGVEMKDGLLTGTIGRTQFPSIQGHKLLNLVDTFGVSIGSYYPYDLIPIVQSNGVYMLSMNDILRHSHQPITREHLRLMFEDGKILNVIGTPDDAVIDQIHERYYMLPIMDGYLPARAQLIELDSQNRLSS